MQKFRYVKIDGYLPIIEQVGGPPKHVDWYVQINTACYGPDGLGRDKDGNIIRTGEIVAMTETEAYEIVKMHWKHVGEFKIQVETQLGWRSINNDLKSHVPSNEDALVWLRRQYPVSSFRVVFERKEN